MTFVLPFIRLVPYEHKHAIKKTLYEIEKYRNVAEIINNIQ